MTAVSRLKVATPQARKYLVRFCKHWAHHADASYDDSRGRVQFATALCTFEADDSHLTVVVETAEGSDLPAWEQTVDSHLRRFGPGEEFLIEWIRDESKLRG